MISEVMPIGRSQASFHETVEGLHIPYANSGGAASPKRFVQHVVAHQRICPEHNIAKLKVSRTHRISHHTSIKHKYMKFGYTMYVIFVKSGQLAELSQKVKVN